MSTLLITKSILALVLVGALGLKVVPQAAKVVYMNGKYIKDVKFTVRRYERRGDYYLNLEVFVLHTWMNNFTVSIILTEYLHNEYRRSFIELHHKYCDLINKEPYVGLMLKKRGLTCPLLEGEHHAMNMTVQTENFPNVFPFNKGGANVEIFHTETKEPVLNLTVHALFIQKRTKKP